MGGSRDVGHTRRGQGERPVNTAVGIGVGFAPRADESRFGSSSLVAGRVRSVMEWTTPRTRFLPLLLPLPLPLLLRNGARPSADTFS